MNQAVVFTLLLCYSKELRGLGRGSRILRLADIDTFLDRVVREYTGSSYDPLWKMGVLT